MTSWLLAISQTDALRDYIRIGREQVFDNLLASIESFEQIQECVLEQCRRIKQTLQLIPQMPDGITSTVITSGDNTFCQTTKPIRLRPAYDHDNAY